MPTPDPHPAIAAGDVAVLELYVVAADTKHLRVVMCPSFDRIAAEAIAAVMLVSTLGDKARALELLDEVREQIEDAPSNIGPVRA